jgi:hypothetical protein
MTPTSRRRIGYVLTGLVILFLLFDSVGKLLRLRQMVEGTAALGYPDSAVRVIGAILLVCLILYMIPHRGAWWNPSHRIPRRRGRQQPKSRQPAVESYAVSDLRRGADLGESVVAGGSAAGTAAGAPVNTLGRCPRVLALPAARPGVGPRSNAPGPPGVAAAGARSGITRMPRVATGPANLTRCGFTNRDHRIVIIDAVRH